MRISQLKQQQEKKLRLLLERQSPQKKRFSQPLQIEKRVNEARAAKLAKKNADLAAKAAAGKKAEVIVGEAEPAEETIQSTASEETTQSAAPEETASETVAEDKPQE